MSGSAIFLLVIAVMVLIRLLVGRLNHNRIREYIAGRGGRVLDIQWNPFGPGWYGERDSVIYSVRYKDEKGNVKEADCKTSLFSGVYFSNEKLVKAANRPSPMAQARHEPEQPREVEVFPYPGSVPESYGAGTEEANSADEALRDENRRLREENRQLREELDRLRRW